MLQIDVASEVSGKRLEWRGATEEQGFSDEYFDGKLWGELYAGVA